MQPKKERLCVDHCHATGRIRGLLCRKCNSALAYLREEQRTMIAALAYLAYHATDAAGAAAQRALLVRAALPPAPGARAVLTEVHLPALLRRRSTRAAGIRSIPAPATRGGRGTSDEFHPLQPNGGDASIDDVLPDGGRA
jgi:hypothetical protein